MWTIKSLSIFCVAAALGALVRLGLGMSFQAMGQEGLLPWAVFTANVLGCFLFGLGWVYMQCRQLDARALLVGFMGSLTTFSSYAYDIYCFILAGQWGYVFLYGLVQMVLALVFLHAGMVCMQKYLDSRH